jgi:nucleoid-associated protein YgaU
MRKDVKLGLAVGGMLLVLVVLYLVIVGQQKNTVAQDNNVQVVHPDGADATADKPAPAPAAPNNVKPAPAPVADGAAAPADPLRDSRESGANPKCNWAALYAAEPAGDTPGGGSGPGGRTETPVAPLKSGEPESSRDAASRTPATPMMAVTPAEHVADHTDPIIALPAGGPSTRPTAQRTHVVKENESFWSIAAAEYGNGTYHTAIEKANPNAVAHALRVGQTLIIPDISDLKPSRLVAVAPATRPVVDSRTHYTVRQNDSLYSISRDLYGRGDRVTRIYELNKQVIGPDMRALKVGMVLTLPEAPTVNH